MTGAAVGILPAIRRGDPGPRPPVVLLHGFGGDAFSWLNVQLALARRRETIAFDLPGHGRAFDWPEVGNAGRAAKAVTESLARLAIPRVHLVGHSMGGAVAALMALRTPGIVASLTLFAPGGFGRAIDAALLRAYASARTAAEIEPLLPRFFGAGFRLPRRMAEAVAATRDDARIAALTTVADAILDGGEQKTVDREGLAGTGIPLKVVWGTHDAVLPITQTDDLPPAMALHRIPGAGHMPHLEALALAIRLIGEQAAGE